MTWQVIKVSRQEVSLAGQLMTRQFLIVKLELLLPTTRVLVCTFTCRKKKKLYNENFDQLNQNYILFQGLIILFFPHNRY